MAYSILDYIEYLTPVEGKGKHGEFYCPNCGSKNFKIGKGDPAPYKCFEEQCESEQIRAAIDKLVGKEPYRGNGKPKTIPLEERVARAITEQVAASGFFDKPDDWMPDPEEEVKSVDAEVLPPEEADGEGKTKQTVAQLLLEIAEEFEYWHNDEREAYADLRINHHQETYRVRSKPFKTLLTGELYKRHDRTVGSETLQQVLLVLEAKAIHDAPERQVYLRVAIVDGMIYYDLGTADWRIVKITADKGWTIIEYHNCPVRFRRPSHQLALPVPEPEGDLSALKELMNLEGDSWTLLVCWLLFSLYPDYPHPILILHGEQGTGKSFRARLLKALIDPGKSPLMPEPKDLRDLAIAANNRWLLAFDNLSGINALVSDALCRISTGGGFSCRTLYENAEETVFEFIRPMILTGIDSLATRGDLLERAILVSLTLIPEEQRKTEAELMAEFERVKGKIFGALLTALSKTLVALPNTSPERLPRMADFARFAIAAESALGLEQGDFLMAYCGNRETAHEVALESSPLAVSIMRLMEKRNSWSGTATQLLTELEPLTAEKTLKSRLWPSTPAALGRALTRLAPDLRGVGIEFSSQRNKEGMQYRLDRIGNLPTFPTPPTPDPQNPNSEGVSSDVGSGVGNEGFLHSPTPSLHPAVIPQTQLEQGFQPEDVGSVGSVGEKPSLSTYQLCSLEAVSNASQRSHWIPQVGDRVRYRGRNSLLNRAINGKTLTLQSPGLDPGYWLVSVPGGVSQTVPLEDLELISTRGEVA